MEFHHAPRHHRRRNHGLRSPQEGQSGVTALPVEQIESTHAAIALPAAAFSTVIT
jgi:hypothetical protein